VIVWDIADINDCKEICQLEPPIPHRPVTSICFTPGGENIIIASADILALYDVASGSLLKRSDDRIENLMFVQMLASTIITASSDGIFAEWDMNLTIIRQLPLGVGIWRTVFSATQDTMAVATNERLLVLLETASLEPLMTLEMPRNVHDMIPLQFSLDGNQLLVGLNNGFIAAFDVIDGAFLFEFEFRGSVCYSFDGTEIYGRTDDSDGTMLCWDAATGTPIHCPFPSEEWNSWGGGPLFVIPGGTILM
jgi:WD40 repeat protein